MKRRGRRLGRVMRWGVYGCTLALLAMLVLSIWLEPYATFEYMPTANQRRSRTFTGFELHQGVLKLARTPDYRQMYFSMPDPGWHSSFGRGRVSFVPAQYMWYGLPSVNHSNGSRGSTAELVIPLVWPMVILVGLGLYLRVRGCKSKRAGCASCGYPLADLPTNTCPECGVEHG